MLRSIDVLSRTRYVRVVRAIASLLLGGGLSSAGAGAQSSASPPPDTALARADSMFAARDFAAAASAFESLTRTHPAMPRYWVRYGSTLQALGRTPEAMTAYRRAIGITVAPVAMYNLASLFAKQGQADSAFHWLDQTVNAGLTNDSSLAADPDMRPIRADARWSALIARMRALRAPCRTRTESRMFDFWVGEWEVTNSQGQHAGTSSVQLLLEGCALYENWTDGQNGQGKSLNSFNPDLGLWQQFWTDQYGRVTEYRQSEWVGGSLRYTAHQRTPQGGDALLHMTFTPVNPDLVRQFGERSTDGGTTWTPTFDLYYHRKR